MRNLLLVSLIIITTAVSAQKIPFQGRLLDDGRPFNGTATLDFSISDPVWSESKADVSVIDGYYSVVLGEETPLPGNLFIQAAEVELNITVNGEALSPVTLYSTLFPHTGDDPIDSVKSSSFQAIGADDETRASLTTTNDGYDGLMLLGDSLGRGGNFMRTRTSGGYLQLAQQDFTDDSFRSAAILYTSGDQNSLLDLYGGNAAGDGTQLMVRAYSSNIDLNGPIPDGYRTI